MFTDLQVFQGQILHPYLFLSMDFLLSGTDKQKTKTTNMPMHSSIYLDTNTDKSNRPTPLS